MTTTWSHLCNANNSFSTLQLTQDCKACGIDHRVQAIRYEGYSPLAFANKSKSTGNSIKSKLATLLKPKIKQSKLDEHQNSYYDRQG